MNITIGRAVVRPLAAEMKTLAARMPEWVANEPLRCG